MSETIDYDLFIWLLDKEDSLVKYNTRTGEDEKIVLKYKHNGKEKIYKMDDRNVDIFSLDKDTIVIISTQKSTVDIFDLKTKSKIDAAAIQGYSVFLTNTKGELTYIIPRYGTQMYKVADKKISPFKVRPFEKAPIRAYLNRYIAIENNTWLLYDVLSDQLIITNTSYKGMGLLESPNNTLIYTNIGKATLIEWNIRENKFMREIKLPFTKIISIQILPHTNGEYFIIVTKEGDINFVYSTKTGSYYKIELYNKSTGIKAIHLCGIYLRLLRLDDKNDTGVAFNILTKKVIMINAPLSYFSTISLTNTKALVYDTIVDFSTLRVDSINGRYIAKMPIYRTEDKYEEFLNIITDNTIVITLNIRRLIINML